MTQDFVWKNIICSNKAFQNICNRPTPVKGRLESLATCQEETSQSETFISLKRAFALKNRAPFLPYFSTVTQHFEAAFD